MMGMLSSLLFPPAIPLPKVIRNPGRCGAILRHSPDLDPEVRKARQAKKDNPAPTKLELKKARDELRRMEILEAIRCGLQSSLTISKRINIGNTTAFILIKKLEEEGLISINKSRHAHCVKLRMAGAIALVEYKNKHPKQLFVYTSKK